MLRVLFFILVVLCCGLLFLNGRMQVVNNEKPIFLKTDKIAENHSTNINLKVTSLFKPSNEELNKFKKDYANIWAHLNNMYTTNNVINGKEYYSEDWFKQVCKYYNHKPTLKLSRSDSRHQVEIKNWAWDGLVCTITDTVALKYVFAKKADTLIKTPISMVLLFQGDNWRIDALNTHLQ
jgi:hypothetical protein